MGERELIGLCGFIVLFALLALRVPVGLAMVLVGIGGNFALSIAAPFLRFEPFLRQFKTLLWGTVANYELSVVPLFILMGLLASHAGLSRDLFRGLNALIGRVQGGVAMAAIGACAGFGAVCGSSLATASTMGRVALPELARLNYAPRLATGTLAAGGTLGILIPPSVALVLYAIIVEASIVDMFQAAIVPGLMAVAFFVAVIGLTARLSPESAPKAATLDRAERRADIRRLVPVLAIFGAIVAGLGLGLFTPTPAAAIGATAILVYGFYLRAVSKPDADGHRAGLTLSGLKASFLETAVMSAMIYFILFGAEVLKGFFAKAGLPAAMAAGVSGSGLDPYVVLLVLLFALIVLGCFMDSLAMILVVLPFFWPALVALNGGDYVLAADAAFYLDAEDLKIWFGVVALVVVELGLITPPVGLNVFVIAQISRTPMGEVFRGVAPFFAIELMRVALLIAFPALCLFLPHLLGG
ncbi:MAG: TRAP transporter large permease [Pseudomonadota bacterium]